jgi:UDP-N-acetylglucosamine transferase subunit ALG13
VILLTVGTQLPFDRLVRAVDAIAPSIESSIFAQIGESRYKPCHMAWSARLKPIEFEERMHEARVLISHAGVGSILTAQRHSKPIILFPRRAQFGEHRNDHQLATARTLAGHAGVYIAADEHQLEHFIRTASALRPCEPSQANRDRLRQRLEAFIAGQ